MHYVIGHYDEEIALMELYSQIYSLWSQKSLTPKHSTHWPNVIIIIYDHIILTSEIRSNKAKGYFMVNQQSFLKNLVINPLTQGTLTMISLFLAFIIFWSVYFFLL